MKPRISLLLCALVPVLGCHENIAKTPKAAQLTSAANSRQLAGEDLSWPNIFGPHHNSRSYEQGLITEWPDTGPPELWRREVGEGYSAPVVLGKRLILFHRLEDEEVIDCLHAETGEPLWQHRYPTAYACLFEYSDGPYCTPVIEDNLVWTVGAEGKLHCLAIDDGSVQWQRDLKSDFLIEETLFGVGASPFIYQGSLILNVGGSKPNCGIVALNKRTGKTLWAATDHRGSYCTPIVATIHDQVYTFVMTFEGLVALDPADGSVFWEIPFRRKAADAVNATSPMVVRDFVFITTGPGIGSRCLRVLPDKSYEEVWKGRRNLDSQFNNLVAHAGYLYGYTSKWNRGATFNCVDVNTGEVRWRHDSELMRGSSILAGKNLILWGELGHLASMKVDSQAPEMNCITADPLLESPCFSAPALAAGLLYLRNEHELLCLNLRKNSDR